MAVMTKAMAKKVITVVRPSITSPSTLEKPNDVDGDVLAFELAADLFQALRNLVIVEFFSGLWVDLEQVGAHHGGLQIVADQRADLTGLGHVGAYLGQALFVGLEARRNQHLAHVAVFGDLDVFHVRCEQRIHLAAVDAGREEDLVRHATQGFEKFLVIDIALPALPFHAHQNAVGSGEGG